MLVYKITNLVNGKAYIGCTAQPIAHRWKTHRAQATFGCTFPLHRALRKYGVDNFRFEILYECIDVREMHATERALIAAHGTYAPNGYNITGGGEGTFGRILTDATRKKMSASQKRMHAEGRGYRRKPGEYRHSAEAKAKMSAAWHANPNRRAIVLAAARSNSILSEADVAEIKWLLANGGRTHPIAKLFGVSDPLIASIRTGSRRDSIAPAASGDTTKLAAVSTPKPRGGPPQKVKDSDIPAILSALKRGERQSHVAATYGVSQSVIANISVGRCRAYFANRSTRVG